MVRRRPVSPDERKAVTESTLQNHRAVCPSCGLLTDHDANFCEHCGAEMHVNGDVSYATAEVIADPAADTVVISPEDRRKIVERAESETLPGRSASHMVGFQTDIGLSHHVNQDAGGAWTRTRGGVPVSLITVADGVSAGRHSEEASRLTIDTIRERMLPLLDDESQDIDALLAALLESARTANRAVAQRPHPSLASADATTLVAAVCLGDQGAGVWCGDSRVYRCAPGSITRLTRDHSWAEGVVSLGIMSEEDAALDPRAHMITRWLGPPEQDDPGFETFQFQLVEGETVLCCTDGLYMYFAPPSSSEAEMLTVLQQRLPNVEAAMAALIEIALQRGGRDNVTAAAIYLETGENGDAVASPPSPELRRAV